MSTPSGKRCQVNCGLQVNSQIPRRAPRKEGRRVSERSRVSGVEGGGAAAVLILAIPRGKSEIRGPKSERSPKAEGRTQRPAGSVVNSDFEFRTSFGFRPSGFGNWAPDPPVK